MKIDDYQKWTRTTAIYEKNDFLAYLSNGLSSEVGEVCGIIKRFYRKDGDLNIEDLKSELSDCLWYIARLADEYNIKMNDIIEYNISKLTDRKNRNVIKGSGNNR